jgi:hypothetical protein
MHSAGNGLRAVGLCRIAEHTIGEIPSARANGVGAREKRRFLGDQRPRAAGEVDRALGVHATWSGRRAGGGRRSTG